MHIMFCFVIAIPKGMFAQHSLKVSYKLDITIRSKLHIEKLKFVHSSCCFTIPELVLSDQLSPNTIICEPTYSGQQSSRRTYYRTIFSSEKSQNDRF